MNSVKKLPAAKRFQQTVLLFHLTERAEPCYNSVMAQTSQTDIRAVSLPASKSILARAMILAALRRGDTMLFLGELCEDAKTMAACLSALGVQFKIEQDGLLMHGTGGNFCKKARLNVQDAGTAARFLPPLLAFTGGEYFFSASEQMTKRPMDGLALLQEAGADIEFFRKDAAFPFALRAPNGVRAREFTVNTTRSTQFASGMILAACAAKEPVKIRVTGSEAHSPYLKMTADLLNEFGFSCKREKDCFILSPENVQNLSEPFEYAIEPDVSAACYFGALALLCRKKILLLNVFPSEKQGDFAFLRLLEARGLSLKETREGLVVDGANCESFCGFQEDFKDFPDQVPTAAVLAPFASTPSKIRNVSRLRFHESDRMHAIVQNLTALGVPARENGSDIEIFPAPISPCRIKTFSDHRIAMAFSVLSRRVEGVEIDNPACVKKTFENFFHELGKVK